ncbi:unnamed protein product [Schistosoma turkestanicum]|nr:unnamed protein product [Schistosoma turkestanicum]
MAFSHTYTYKQDNSTSYPLLATICDRPDWSTLRVWCINSNNHHQNHSSKSFPLSNDIKTKHSTFNARQQQPIKLKTAISKRTTNHERGVRMKTFLANFNHDNNHNNHSNNNNNNNNNSLKIQDEILFSQSMEKYPYAIATYSSSSSSSGGTSSTTPPPSPTNKAAATSASAAGVVTSERSSDRSHYRFRHCQFMKYSPNSSISSNHLSSSSSSSSSPEGLKISKNHTAESMLVTTIQPLCANRRSFSRLVVWSVPHPSETVTCDSSSSSCSSLSNNHIKMYQPIQLNIFAETTFPQGHLPACLAVHPSRSRGLIGVGTMEGRVDVYL